MFFCLSITNLWSHFHSGSTIIFLSPIVISPSASHVIIFRFGQFNCFDALVNALISLSLIWSMLFAYVAWISSFILFSFLITKSTS